ncbi:expressed unknown protein [Seminavis robusta]|uniref:Methyltransferase FkbM domain-containing protein n=1 Tax=Seminavis robusta TaxID=568900 RepID=A0A9N8EGC3_9STRA|nr:expressed unknown protein [Seminavis robusta]|eukprot:Sro951_g223870.1 n/a (611) ;mRNA; f:15373-17205
MMTVTRPRAATTKKTKSSLVIVILVTASLCMVVWFLFSSITLARSVNNDNNDNQNISPQEQASSSKLLLTRSLGSRRQEKILDNSESARWETYKSVYNYQAPLLSNPPSTAAEEECGFGPTYAKFFEQGRDKRSRYMEDKAIYKAFFKERLTGTGTYVEMGAFDGQSESNSRFYDLCLGWKGLLIEANPLTYQKTVQNRPHAHRMSFAPSCKDVGGTVEFYKYPMTNAGQAGKAVTYEGKPTVSVPCGPLGRVLEDVFKGETIHFFSLDVEGVEPQVLATINFEKVKIDVLMVEVDNYFCKENCKLRDTVREIMTNAGYTRHDGVVRASDVFTRPGATFSLIRNYVSRPDPRIDRQKRYKETYDYRLPTNSFQSTPEECGKAPNYMKFFNLPSEEHSRSMEDKIIYHMLFKGRLNHNQPGTYVELGAFDGKSESNTRFFDVCLGWKGLLIEGHPDLFLQAVNNRPQAHRMKFAPSCKEDGTVQFYNYPMSNTGLEGKALEYKGKPTITVPCGPLGPVLEDLFAGERISFLSLDVEGSESMVLETIDFKKVMIDVLMVEVSNKHCVEGCKNRNDVRAIMKKAGYKRFGFGSLVQTSDVYVHPDSPYQPQDT